MVTRKSIWMLTRYKLKWGDSGETWRENLRSSQGSSRSMPWGFHPIPGMLASWAVGTRRTSTDYRITMNLFFMNSILIKVDCMRTNLPRISPPGAILLYKSPRLKINPGNYSLGQIPWQLPSGTILPWTASLGQFPPGQLTPLENFPLGYLPLDNSPPKKILQPSLWQ